MAQADGLKDERTETGKSHQVRAPVIPLWVC